ncbi:cytoplasmic protein [Marmoricola sp. Leaf446]|uniref:winged helix-turn-helix domain-containing protein n=1 Tax=Marmoricola sp. Leaf446 TaxID=1736379 RepID=UPI0006FC316C|nr:crosslink repair DNA glycosylase YcaQ family protein [Marmoricola sp. Leaf446]KQT89358.1 cytoplasmic protein [Marmoricola sp. Leaf446]
MTAETHLSAAQARRVALVAQGFRDPVHQPPTLRTLSRTLERTGVLQVDSVNVLQRAHYLPLYSRMGPYDPDLLGRASEVRPRRMVEYWAHVQAFMPVELWPVMQHRMAGFRTSPRWGGWLATNPGLVDRVREDVAARGPTTARDLDDGAPRSREHWGWNWSEARKALDWLYLVGELAIAGRTASFECVYDLPERVLPAAVLATPTPSPEEATRELVRRAARSHGVATVRCLSDYYRLQRSMGGPGQAATARAVAELVESGELLPARVEGWARPAYLHRDAVLPRRVHVRSLVSPFDPLVWERERTERLFDFHYRIEIYVPQHLRRHGYYVLPFVLGDRIVARVDLKADRPGGRLLVQAAYAEPGAPSDTAPELAAELRRTADWLGLDDVVVRDRGDLAPALGAVAG